MTENQPIHSPLHAKHLDAAASMGAEAGWLMPMSFGGALEEAAVVRSRAGVFDLSHCGRIRIRGDGALDLLERLCTADVARQEDDTVLATCLCTPAGGIIDACRLVRLEDQWLLLTSPLCRNKVLEHITAAADGGDVKVDDQTEKTALVAVAGPAGPRLLDACLPMKVSDLADDAVKSGSLLVARYVGIRSTFGGLWTLEVMLPNMMASQAWRFITEKAGANAVPPAGLAAHDILRIEGGQGRYGHELNETIDPFLAGLGGQVTLNHDFVGADALARLHDKPPARKLMGLTLSWPLSDGGVLPVPVVPRLGDAVFRDGLECGTATSGTFSPALDKPIALAYVSADHAQAGAEVEIAIDNARHPATLCDLPFVGGAK